MLDLSNFISPKQQLEMKKDVVEETLVLAYPIVALEYCDGIMLLGENPSASLNKTSEIYDRIAFAGTGVFNDYERLRKAGVQLADVKGFQYSRSDVKARSIASEFSTVLGDIFVRQPVPMEVEILIVEIGEGPDENRMYYIPFSGGLVEERHYSVIGDYVKEEGEIRKGAIRRMIKEADPPRDASLEDAASFCVRAIGQARGHELTPERIELVALDRGVSIERKFRRFSTEQITELFG